MVPKYHLPHATSMRHVLRHGKRLQYVKPMLTPEERRFCSTPVEQQVSPRGGVIKMSGQMLIKRKACGVLF